MIPFRRLLSAVALLAVAACAQPPVPTDTFYRLEVPEPQATAQAAVGGVIEVRPFEADGLAAERAMVYAEGDGALRQYNYHYWVESPTAAIQRELTDHLRATGLFDQVVTPRFRVRPDVEVQGRVARLEQRLDGAGAARMVVEMEIGAQRTGRGLELVVLRTYTVEREAADASPAAAAEATRSALREIFDRFTADLAAGLRQSAAS